MVKLKVRDHELFIYLGYAELKTLIEALSERIDISLTLLDAETGRVIVSTDADWEWFDNNWLFIKGELSSLPAGVPKVITYDSYSMLCSCFSLGTMGLVLLTGSRFMEGATTQATWPLSEEMDQYAPDFELVQHLLWQYLQGQVSTHYEHDFVTLIEKAQLPNKQLTADDCYRNIVELAATIPGVVMAGVRVITPAGTGKLVASIGGCPDNRPKELPIAGIWGKTLQDGQVRLLDNFAEDPGIPSHLAQRLAPFSAIYLPLGLGDKMIAVLIIAFDNRETLHSPHIRELLTLVKRRGSTLVTLAQASETLLSAKRQLRGQAHLVDSLAESNLESLADIEDMISVLWGLSWVKISLEDVGLERDNPDLVHIPLHHAGSVIANVYAKRPEIEALGQEVLELGIDFLSHFVNLWRKLVERPQPRASAPDNLLTPRELEVVQLIAQGESNKTAAAKLNLSERTVKTHVSNILRKLNLPDRTAIAVWYTKNQR